jgi:glutathione S-transferase
MRYELYYWDGIQGRGEFVRLALEEAQADYVDVAREAGGEGAMLRLLDGEAVERPPLAPPYLRAGRLLIGQTANILLYLGPRHGLAPTAEAGRLWAHQLQLTIADLVDEAHDTHHPIASSLYYEDQRPEAKRRADDFLKLRVPKYLGYFEKVLARNTAGSGHLVGGQLTYPDLSLFQVVAGLRYAFPRAMARLGPTYRRVVGVHDMVAARPRIAAYLASSRRIAFNEHGIFRHYPELDVAG